MQFFSKTKQIPEEVPPPTREQVQHRLDTAKLAEHRDSYSPFGAGAAEAEFPHLNIHEYSDGIWVCCCGRENPLVHYKGAYPFKKLTCGQCDKVLCGKCLTTKIVTPLQDAEYAVVVKQEKSKLRGVAEALFQICPDCGLSTRAQIRNPDHHGERLCWVPVASHSHSEMCSCGASAKSNWLKFVIGDSSTFRLDPQKAIYDLKEDWVRKKSQALASRYPLKRVDSVQKPPESGWEKQGYRRAQASKASQDACDSVKDLLACSLKGTLLESRPAEALEPLQNPKHSVQDNPVPFPLRTRTVREPVPVPPARQRPAPLTLVQNQSSLKRSGAVRGKYTPRLGSHSSTNSGSYLDTPATARPRVPVRAETWAIAAEHQRTHEEADAAVQSFPPSYFDLFKNSSYAQPITPFELTKEETVSFTQADIAHTPQFVRKPSTMTIRAPQPVRRVATDGPLLRHGVTTGDGRRQPLARSHTTMSSHSMIEKADWSDGEATPRQSLFRAQTELSSTVLDETDWSDMRQSMDRMSLTANDMTEEKREEDPLENVKSFYITHRLKLTEDEKTAEKREDDLLKHLKSFYKNGE